MHEQFPVSSFSFFFFAFYYLVHNFKRIEASLKRKEKTFCIIWARFSSSSTICECLIVSLGIEYELFCLAFAALNVRVDCGMYWYACSCLILRTNFI